MSGCTPSRGREHREVVRGVKELFTPTRVWRGARAPATSIQGRCEQNTWRALGQHRVEKEEDTRKEAVEATTKVQGGHAQQRVQEAT